MSLQEYAKKSEELDSLRSQKKEFELRLESLQTALNKSRQVIIVPLA
jgi:chromosome segregation ATPase